MNTRNARQNSSLTQRILFGLATATICFGSAASPVYAIDANTVPTGGTGDTGVIINAAATDTNNQTTMNITQTVNNAVINWGTFNVGSNATINFIQTANGLPNTAAMTLNRVASTGGMSEIAGNINSIGTFILINPNGIMFDGTSTVNAAGIIASTANITDENFKAGKLIFEQNGTIDGNITVNGKLNASTNGSYLGDVNGNSGMLKTAYEALKDSTILNTSKLQPAAGFSIGNNVIKLVADGDITVGSTGSLQAVTTTHVSGTSTVGTEEYTVEGSGSTREGSILLRADQNVNELAKVDTTSAAYDSTAITRYDSKTSGTGAVGSGAYKVAKVYLDNTAASQIASQHVGVYYEPDITSAGINGTTTASIGISTTDKTQGSAVVKNFTQKDYTKYSTEATAYLGKITETPTIISNSLSATDTASNTVSTSKTADRTISMLVNNVYQLQAIQDVKINDTSLTGFSKTNAADYYGNLGGGYAQGTTISAAETANWTSNGMSGFDPIGTNSNAFTGHFTGNGGSDTYGIYDLHIAHTSYGSDKDNYTGLFAAINTANIWSTTLIDPVISGDKYVGGIAGYALNSTIQGTTVRKRNGAANSDGADTVTATSVNVQGNGDYVGGLVGQMSGTTSISRNSSNESTVTGANYVGGLVGSMTDSSKITDSHNKGYTSDATNLDAKDPADSNKTMLVGVITGTSNVGGLAGDMQGTASIGVAESNSSTYNSGQVNGTTDVGGLVGRMGSGTSITQAYNTNEAKTLGTSTGSVIYSADAIATKSLYGKVTGTNGVTSSKLGGLVGEMTGGSITTAYNAGNVSGTDQVGGLVGSMTGGTIAKAYNADNNTVLMQSKDETDAVYVGFTVTKGETAQNGTYSYDSTTQKWIKDNDANNEIATTDLPDGSLRIFNNRLAYRDANVTGTTNVGGLVGNMNAGTGSITQAYNAGKVTGDTANSTGALIGTYTAGTLGGTNNTLFYATTDAAGANVSNGTNADTAFGNKADTEGVSGITNNSLTKAANVAWKDSANTTLASDNTQNNDWIVYNDSAAPLLKAFMTSISIKRQYRYDGTTHNLITSDVGNYYGGAFFTGDKGKVVNDGTTAVVSDWSEADFKVKSGSSSDDHSKSSAYLYDQANMWSPQHAYFTKGTAEMIVTAAPLTVTLTGTKTYGQTAVTNAATTASDGKYTVAYNGFVNNEGTSVLTGDLTNVKYTSDAQNLGAKEYTLSTATINNGYTGSTNSNYSITYAGTLTVNKADLYVKIDGEREYGNANSTGTYTYSEVGKATDEAASASNDGKLKSWDTLSVTAVTGKVPTLYSTSDVYHNGTRKDTKEIGTDANVVVDGNKAVTTYTLGDGTSVNGAATAANYNLIFDTNKGSTGTMRITPAALSCTISGSNTYGQTNYAYTSSAVTGIKSIDTTADVIGTDNLTEDTEKINTAGEAARTIKDYNNTTHVKRDMDGNVVNLITNETVALPTDAGVVLSLKDGNYNYTTVSTQFTYKVNPAALTYTVTGDSKTYGNTTLAHTTNNTSTGQGTFAGFVGTESAATAYNNTGIKSNVSTPTYKVDSSMLAANAAVNRTNATDDPGSYANMIDASDLYFNDYAVTVNKGAVTINPKALAITAGQTAKTYGDAEFTKADAVFNGLIATDAGLAVNTNYTKNVDGSLTQYSAAGTYADKSTVALTNADTFKNYTVTLNPNAAVINQREVTYTVDDVTRAYGGDTTFTGHYNNVVNNDTVGTVDQTGYNVTGGDTILSHTDVGSYAITTTTDPVQSGITNTNYKLAATNPITNTGSLTITKADLYFTANGDRVYGTANGIDTIKSITAVKTGTADTDALNDGAIKSWDVSDRGIANLAGYTKPNEVSLIATENARTGSTTTSTTIGTPTWVKGSAVSPQAYSLAKGSFQNADGTNQFTSKNYNLIYIGNTEGGAANGTYTITPLTASYNVTTNSVYGSGVRTNETSTILDQHEQTITGEAQTALLDGLAKQFDLIHQHVTGETPSAVTKISTEAGGLVGNPNYLLTGGSYTYTITPASVTYKANDDSWTSGLSAPDQPLSGGFIDGRNGDRIVTDGIGLSTTITSASPVGTYLDSIFAKGPAHAGSAGNLYDYYVMYRPGTMVVNAASDPVYDAAIHGALPTTKASQDIANQLSGKDGAGMTVKAGDAAGGYIPREARDSIRFVTIEDTGVNLQMVSAGNTTITIDAASQIGGSGAITITGSGEAHSIAGTATATEVAQQMAADEKLAASSKLVQASNIAANSGEKDVTSAAENGTGTETLPAVEAAPADSTTVTAAPEPPANAPTDTAAANAPTTATASPSAETASVQSVKATAATENTNTKEEQKKRRIAAEQ